MNSIKKLLKIPLKYVRELIRDYEDLSVPKDFSSNLQINDDMSVSLNLKFPPEVTALRFDIGLSHNAPNSARWLLSRADLLVVGIEANRFNVHKLLKGGMWSKNDPVMPIKPFKSDRFKVLYCAIDNVKLPCFSNFYNIRGDAGTSSLLEPTARLLQDHEYSIKAVSEVPTVPLSLILKQIPWDRFNYIELCKVDTQGKDLDVLKSTGEYLQKIALISTEVETFGQYKGAAKRQEIYDFMHANNFFEVKVLSNIENEVVDVLFGNKAYMDAIPELIKTI